MEILSDQGIPFSKAVLLAEKLLVASFLDLTLVGFLFMFTTALLIGINIALFMFYLHAFRTKPSSMSLASGFLGAVAALFGFGCAACGSVFILSLLAASGGGSLIALFPFEGEEIGYAGVALLLTSAFFLTRAINKPIVCPI